MVKQLNISDKEKKVTLKEKVSTKVNALNSEKKESLKEKVSNQQQAPVVTKPKRVISKKVKIVLLSISILIVIGIGIFFYFGIYKTEPSKPPTQLINIGDDYVVSSTVQKTYVNLPIPIPTEPKTEISPLNGLLFTKTEMDKLRENRPVAVMINNHVQARPQSGLNSADIVYEALVESGITRYLAIFWSNPPAKVGPIRSARQYYLEWLNPFDPLYIYDGCASSTDSRVNACGNISTYKIKSIATLGAWRWNDGVRYAPHNEYSSILTAWDYAEDRGWDSMPNIKALDFKKDASTQDRGTKTKVKVTFYERLNNSGLYDTVWTYDSRTNTYLNETGGRALIDQETNTQVYAKSVIIQEVNMIPTYDEKGRIILTTIGKGDATYLIDGKIYEGRWEKTSRTSRTSYYDTQGNEIQFNRGRIWITVMPRSVGKFAIIEQ